jgi:transcriptional regulator of aromatic amino acid metabolism
MARKKDPFYKDMVRVASIVRSENGEFLRDDSGEMSEHIQEQFKKFSFLNEDSVRRTLNNYLNNID